MNGRRIKGIFAVIGTVGTVIATITTIMVNSAQLKDRFDKKGEDKQASSRQETSAYQSERNTTPIKDNGGTNQEPAQNTTSENEDHATAAIPVETDTYVSITVPATSAPENVKATATTAPTSTPKPTETRETQPLEMPAELVASGRFFIDLVEKKDGNQFYLYATSNYDFPTIILENSQGNSLNISAEFKESGFDSRTSNVGLCYSATRDEVYLCLSTGHLLKINDDLSYSVVLKSLRSRTTSEANSAYSCELANGLMYIYMYKGFVDITAGTVKRYEMGNDGVIQDQLVDVNSEKVTFYDMGGNETKIQSLVVKINSEKREYSTFEKALCFADNGMYIFDSTKSTIYFYDGIHEEVEAVGTFAINGIYPKK